MFLHMLMLNLSWGGQCYGWQGPWTAPVEVTAATGCGAAQVLILDEISMISAEMFNALEQMARDLKGSQEPFGRIQLILAGDFFQ